MGAINAAKEGDIILEAEMLRHRMLANARAVLLDVGSEAIWSLFHRIRVGFEPSSRKAHDERPRSNSYRTDKHANSHLAYLDRAAMISRTTLKSNGFSKT